MLRARQAAQMPSSATPLPLCCSQRPQHRPRRRRLRDSLSPWSASTAGVASKPERVDPSASDAARQPGAPERHHHWCTERRAAFEAISPVDLSLGWGGLSFAEVGATSQVKSSQSRTRSPRGSPSAISIDARPPLLASGAHSIGFRLEMFLYRLDLTRACEEAEILRTGSVQIALRGSSSFAARRTVAQHLFLLRSANTHE